MDPIMIKDRMVTNDDLLITNKITSECASPHGRLFQVLGEQNGRRVVKEIACNTVVVGGAITALENLTGGNASWHPETINSIHGLTTEAPANSMPKLALFGIGTGGATNDFGSYTEPTINQQDILEPIPLRYNESIDINDPKSRKYFMKVAGSGNTLNAWYLKTFTSTPVIKSCWKNSSNPSEDGDEISAPIHDSKETAGIETFTEFQIDMDILDGREYFDKTGQLTMARYNTFGFYTGSLTADGTEFANVRLYSAVAFNNRALDLQSKSSFIYRIYSLI